MGNGEWKQDAALPGIINISKMNGSYSSRHWDFGQGGASPLKASEHTDGTWTLLLYLMSRVGKYDSSIPKQKEGGSQSGSRKHKFRDSVMGKHMGDYREVFSVLRLCSTVGEGRWAVSFICPLGSSSSLYTQTASCDISLFQSSFIDFLKN